MNEPLLDLNVVCLVCLCPEKEFCSIFNHDPDTPEMQIVEKITSCSNMELPEKLLQKVPHQICSVCLSELSSTWHFRKKCERADQIFQAMHRQDLEAEELAKVTLKEHKLKLPAGLKVKCVNSLHLTLKLPTKTGTQQIHGSPTDTMKQEADFGVKKSIVLSTEPEDIEFVPDCMNLNDIEATEESVAEQIEYVYPEDYFENSNEELTISIPTSNVSSPTIHLHEKEKGQLSPVILSLGYDKGNNYTNRKPNQLNTEPELETVAIKSDAVPHNKIIFLPSQTTKFTKINKVSSNSIKTLNRKSQKSSLQANKESDCQPMAAKREPATARPSKICDVCGNTYKYQHALNAHMRRHYNERPYPCEVCNKAFVSNVELRRHMRMHTGQKPYGCKFCDRRFSDFGSSKKHERIHTGERPYVCEVCNKGFAYAHVLTVHKRTHTGEKKFPCLHCEKGFTKKVYLLAHMEQHKRAKRLPYLVKDVDLNNGHNSEYNDISMGTKIFLQGNDDDTNTNAFTTSVYVGDKVLEECIVTSEFISDADRLENDNCMVQDVHEAVDQVDDVSDVYPVVLSSDFLASEQLEEHKYIMP